MLRSRTIRASTLLLGLALLALVPVGASAQTKDDVDRARRQLEQAEQQTKSSYQLWADAERELEAGLLRYEEVTSELEDLQYRIEALREQIIFYEDDVSGLERAAQLMVIEAYTGGGVGLVSVAFEAGTIQDLLTSRALIDSATNRDLANLNQLQAVSRKMERLKLDLGVEEEDVQEVEQEVADLVTRLGDLQHQARDAYAAASDAERAAIGKLRREQAELAQAEAARKAAQVAKTNARSGSAGGLAPTATPGFLCPVRGGASFIDSWGFPRSGGRRHKGVDMFAPRNTDLIAVVDGRIKLSSNRLGGLSTHLYSSNGTTYYYAHLEGHPSGLRSGQVVAAGTTVGYLGNSGNARYTSPHLHFEIRPNNVAVNPYPTVRYYCP